MKRNLLLLSPLFLLLCACNTVEGIGKDVQRAGESLERAAEENRD